MPITLPEINEALGYELVNQLDYDSLYGESVWMGWLTQSARWMILVEPNGYTVYTTCAGSEDQHRLEGLGLTPTAIADHLRTVVIPSITQFIPKALCAEEPPYEAKPLEPRIQPPFATWH